MLYVLKTPLVIIHFLYSLAYNFLYALPLQGSLKRQQMSCRATGNTVSTYPSMDDIKFLLAIDATLALQINVIIYT